MTEEGGKDRHNRQDRKDRQNIQDRKDRHNRQDRHNKQDRQNININVYRKDRIEREKTGLKEQTKEAE